MSKSFNYMEHSAELIRQGIPEDKAVEILDKEQDEADFVILDDESWFALLNSITENDEEIYQASLREETASKFMKAEML